MKAKFTAIIFFLFPAFVAAQAFQIDNPPLPIDSLKKVLPSLHDSSRVDCLNELSHSHIEAVTFAHFDSALSLAGQAYAEASSIRYIKGLADACRWYGVLSRWHLWDFGKMEKYFREAISWYQKITNYDGLGRSFLGLGEALYLQNFPENAKDAFEQSAVFFRKTGNRVMLAELIDWSGFVYEEKGDYEKWFENVRMGLREKKSIGDNRGMILSFYRLAYIYQSVSDYETALNYFRQSIVQARSQSIPWYIYNSMGMIFFNLKNYDSSYYYYHEMYSLAPNHATAIIGMGRISLLQREYGKALQLFQEALITFERNGNRSAKARVFAEMGETHAEMKHYTLALQNARESLIIARQVHAADVVQDVYEIYWKVYDALGQKDSSYYYYKKFVPLKDSLEHARLKLQHLQKLALYTVEAKEEEQQARIELLNKDNQLKKQQLKEEAFMKKILVACLTVLILLSIILYRNAALKRKNEKNRRELAENELQIQRLESDKAKAEFQQQATELEMQALRAQMNPHFIFNCLNSINRFILKNETETASDYLTTFSRLIRMALTNSKKTYITLEEELDMLRLYIDLERLRFKNAFNYSIVFGNEIEPENIFIPPLLLQPFAENAIWHGLMHKEEQGHLCVNITREDSILICTITDDGIGRKMAAAFKDQSGDHTSMGMKITETRIVMMQKMNATESTVTINDLVEPDGTAAGTEVIIKIPVIHDHDNSC